MKNRLTIKRIVVGVLLIAVLSVGTSVSRYALANPNDPLQQNVASWARNKGLGVVVDRLELWLHSTPPAVAPVDTLALVAEPSDAEPIDNSSNETSTSLVPSPTTIPGSSAAAIQKPGVASATCPSTATTITAPIETSTTTTVPADTTTTTTSTLPVRPNDIAPLIEPGIKSEGKWRAIARVRTKPIIYATSIRPLWCFGSVVATMATYNPTLVHAGLFNGNEVPAGKGWRNGTSVRGTAIRSLIASFNGGFRFEHNPGGYISEGRTVRKMRKGYATFAIRADGFSTVGIWGQDIVDDGTWVSLRQNLPPLVDKAKSSYANYDKVDWGQDFENKVYNFRSAVCVRTDGLMMFVAIGNVNIGMLADSLVTLGCYTAMQLDINGTWPFFATYGNFGATSRNGSTLDTRMGDPQRHLNGSTKDFIALFDPKTLKPGAVR